MGVRVPPPALSALQRKIIKGMPGKPLFSLWMSSDLLQDSIKASINCVLAPLTALSPVIRVP